MQVRELITFYKNDSSKTLDVSFRLETDSEEEIRNDSILLDEVKNYGYEFLNDTNSTTLNDDESYEEDFDYSDDFLIDEDEVISFLNEYYMINPKKLPNSELF